MNTKILLVVVPVIMATIGIVVWIIVRLKKAKEPVRLCTIGMVAADIKENASGEVIFPNVSKRRTFPATSTDHKPIPKGTPIKIASYDRRDGLCIVRKTSPR